MSLRQKTEYLHSLALRLTLWYAVIFTVSSLIAFMLFYAIIAAVLDEESTEDLLEDVEELSMLLRTEGLDGFNKEITSEVISEGADKVLFRLINSDGETILATDMSAWEGLDPAGTLLDRVGTRIEPITETIGLAGQEYPARTIYANIGDGNILQIVESLEEHEEFLELLRNSFLLIVPVLMALAALLGWFMARKALAGVKEITQAAMDISKGDLDRRVPQTGRGDELDHLAGTFNGMIDRIQSLIGGMREMTDNIAHDLRSPLARIRGVAESALTSRQSIEDYQSIAADTIEECDRLMHMINTMLDITETEAGMGNNHLEQVDIGQVIHDACELFLPLAEDKNITLSLSGMDAAMVHGNRQYLQRMIANLLDNALKYTARGGSVSVGLTREANSILVAIRDTGIGIKENDLPSIFKRFYRCDQSRSQAGSGLGLSLARAIARAHGGDIRVMSTAGEGSHFTVILPLAKE